MDNTSPLWWFNHPKAIQFIEALRSLFGFGFIFELPLVMMLLAYMGVVEAEKLAHFRVYVSGDRIVSPMSFESWSRWYEKK